MTEGERVSVVIAQELAAVEGVDPIEMEPLYEVIDTDALDALFREPNTQNLTVEFGYEGKTVRVEGPDRVEILSEDQRAESSKMICSD